MSWVQTPPGNSRSSRKTRAKLFPRHQRDDRFISILLVIAAGDQRGADTCEETDFVVDCSSIGLESASMPPLGFAEHTRGGSGGDEWSEALREKVPSGDQRAIRAAAQTDGAHQ